MGRYGRYGWRPYVSVAERRRKAARAMEKMAKKGKRVQPVLIEGRAIARTFWGKAWCAHLESYSDFENRLPRGRAYVRNGSVCHLEVHPGKVSASVCGSDLYSVEIAISRLGGAAWKKIKERCTGGISSILDLLQGRLSEGIMKVVTDRDTGMFPKPREIVMRCSCPDWATMCKHVAAVLYGVGARLDDNPELLFLLRGVNHEELIGSRAEAAVEAVLTKGTRRRIAESDLGEVFGVEIENATAGAQRKPDPSTVKVMRPAPSADKRRKAEPPAPALSADTRHKAARSKPPLSATQPSRIIPFPGDTVTHPPFPAKPTGSVFRALRQRLGLTQKELADMLEVSGAAVSVWERSLTPVRLQLRTRAALEKAWEESRRSGG